MGDRVLTDEEARRLLESDEPVALKEIAFAVAKISNRGEKPTLHDIAIIELAARLDAIKKELVNVIAIIQNAIEEGKL